MTFAGSQLVWQYFPGEGLQLHPLANFGKLNALAKSRRNDVDTAQLLDELLALGVPRGGGLAWEYYFDFDGGKPPWVSGLAQGTAVQAIARAAVRLDRLPELLAAIRAGAGHVHAGPADRACAWPRPRARTTAVLVRAGRCASSTGSSSRSSGSTTSAQLTGDPEAQRLFAEGDAEARVEVAAVRHRRVVAVLARRGHARVRPQLPHAAARLPRQPVRPHAGRRLLHGRDALHELPDARRPR